MSLVMRSWINTEVTKPHGPYRFSVICASINQNDKPTAESKALEITTGNLIWSINFKVAVKPPLGAHFIIATSANSE